MKTKIIAIPSILVLSAAGIAACSNPDEKPSADGSASASQTANLSFDTSSIQAVPEIEALVPDSIKKAGVLKNGASIDYAPAEFFKSDGTTPTGYDVNMADAIAHVMGLKGATTEHAEFATIIPSLGSKFDIGISGFTITADREKEVNMVSFIETGTAFAVAKGNPKNFDSTHVCGATVGVQNGTFQFDYITQLSNDCTAKGEKAVKIMPHDLQTDIAVRVASGQYDATLADSPVIGYTIEKSNGSLEQVGDVVESAPQGIIVPKDNEQLTKAIQAAVQYLMDNGYVEKILATYGSNQGALKTAEINPQV